MKKVSVIIPVYNVEDYLEKCLDSVVNQTLKDIEIIVVNDGSPDNSQKIIDEYKKKDKRIISIMKENGGQASARNLGIKKARGEFLCFVDSDDWIELDMLEVLYNNAKENHSDIVTCDYFRVMDNVYTKMAFIQRNGNDPIKNYILNSSGPCWRIVKRDIIVDNNLYFPEGIIYEDYAVVPLYALFCHKITHVDKPLYYYLIRENSTMTQKKFNKKFSNIIDASDNLYKLVRNSKYHDEYEYSLIINLLRDSYIRLKEYKEGKDILKEISKWIKTNIPNWYKNPYLKKESYKTRLFNFLVYKRCYKLLDFIHNIRK